MAAYVWNGSEWVDSVPSVYGATWTDDNDELYQWDGAEWVLVYPEPAGVLLPVEDLAMSSITHESAVATWTLPEQAEGVVPTNVSINYPENGNVWVEFDYPLTTISIDALQAETNYQLRVKLIIREDGVITVQSPIRSVFFSTIVAPVGAPAEDPGSPGGTSTVFPINGGTGASGCGVGVAYCQWWEWKIEILELDTTTVSWIATGITGTTSGALNFHTYDTSALDNTRTYRLCQREATDTTGDGTADTFGDWECSPSFAGAFDWGVTCGNIPDSPTTGLAAAADAAWAFPKYCNVNAGTETTGWVDAISNTQIGRGAAYAAMYIATNGEFGVLANLEGGGTMTAGLAAIEAAIAVAQDFTIVTRYRFSDGHTLSNGRSITVASYGQGAVVFKIVETATTWYPTVSFKLETSGYVTLTGVASAVALDAEVHSIVLRWDADGDKDLWLDGTSVDTDTSGNDLAAAVVVQPMGWMAAHSLGSNMQQLGWDRLLSDAEIRIIGPGVIELVEIGAEQSGSTGPASSALTVPADRLAGDLLVMHGVNGYNGSDVITGWTLIQDAYSANAGAKIFIRIATGDASDVPTDVILGNDYIFRITAWRNVSDLGLRAAIGFSSLTDDVGGDNVLTAPTLTATNNNCVSVRMYGAHSGGASDQPGDLIYETIYGDLTSTMLASQLYSSLGALGALDATYAANVTPDGFAMTAIIRPLITGRPTFVTGTPDANFSATVTPAYPATTSGETIYCALTQPQGADPTIPSGWTLETSIADSIDGDDTLYLYKRTALATGSESGTVAWTAVRAVACMFSIAPNAVATATHQDPTAITMSGTADPGTLIVLRMNGDANHNATGTLIGADGGHALLRKSEQNAFTAGLFNGLYIYELDIAGNVPDLVSSVGELAITLVCT